MSRTFSSEHYIQGQVILLPNICHQTRGCQQLPQPSHCSRDGFGKQGMLKTEPVMIQLQGPQTLIQKVKEEPPRMEENAPWRSQRG